MRLDEINQIFTKIARATEARVHCNVESIIEICRYMLAQCLSFSLYATHAILPGVSVPFPFSTPALCKIKR
jgi:hypothetical protein